MKLEWIDADPPIEGPPKPYSCKAGWTSHQWTVTIEEGRLSLGTTECRLCHDAIAELEPEYLGGEFAARLILHHEPGQPYYGIDPEVWWEIAPAVEVEHE